MTKIHPIALYQSRDLATGAADKLKVFAQPQRLMILSCLLNGARHVTEIGEVTAIGQPALSQQLAELRRAGLVSTRKAAKQVWYTLADDDVALCVRSMEMIFGGGGASPDVARTTPRHVRSRPASGAAGFAQLIAN